MKKFLNLKVDKNMQNSALIAGGVDKQVSEIENSNLEKQVLAVAGTCDKFEFDSDAERVVMVAREGYLFN